MFGQKQSIDDGLWDDVFVNFDEFHDCVDVDDRYFFVVGAVIEPIGKVEPYLREPDWSSKKGRNESFVDIILPVNFQFGLKISNVGSCFFVFSNKRRKFIESNIVLSGDLFVGENLSFEIDEWDEGLGDCFEVVWCGVLPDEMVKSFGEFIAVKVQIGQVSDSVFVPVKRVGVPVVV